MHLQGCGCPSLHSVTSFVLVGKCLNWIVELPLLQISSAIFQKSSRNSKISKDARMKTSKKVNLIVAIGNYSTDKR